MGALFTTVSSIRVSRVSRVRVTLTVTVGVRRVSVMVSVRDSVMRMDFYSASALLAMQSAVLALSLIHI